MFLPQCISRILFCLVVCVPTLCAPQALAQKQPAGESGSHVASRQLTCVATELQLGEVVVGRASSKLVTITNRGRTSLTVLSAASTGTEFDLNGLDLPLTLAAGESFTFAVTFVPHKSGRVDGSISIVSEAPTQTLTVQLAGTGRATGQLRISPEAIDFGDVNLGAPRTQAGQLTASAGNVTISAAKISTGDFQIGGLSLPVTIQAGHSVPFTVTISAQDNSSSSAILSFASDAENSSAEQAVTVRMLGSVQHKVQLSWKASTSKHIVGYDIYRSNRSGGPYQKINGALDPNTKFMDLTVTAGHKYYYVATAVNWRSRESVHSKQIQVVIP